MKLDNSIRGKDPLVCLSGTGKINTSNPKNKIYQAYKAKVKSITEKKAEQMFEDKTFGDEYQSVFLASNVLKILFSFASACTVFVALYWALYPLLGDLVSVLVALGICLLLEALKGGIWGKLSKNILKYKEYPLILVASAVLFNFLSVGGSIFGAYQLPNESKAFDKNSIRLISIDSISLVHDKMISKVDAIITEQSNELSKTTSNSTKRSISQNIALQSEQKATLINQKSNALSSANAKNEALQNEGKELANKEALKVTNQLEQDQYNCMGVAALFELGLLLCLVFGSYYLFRVEIDRTEEEAQTETAHQEDHNTPSNTIGVNSQPHAAPSVQANTRTIGFKQGNIKRLITDNQDLNTKRLTEDNAKRLALEYTKICSLSSCNKPFIHGHGAQKYCCSKCRSKAHQNKKKTNK